MEIEFSIQPYRYYYGGAIVWNTRIDALTRVCLMPVKLRLQVAWLVDKSLASRWQDGDDPLDRYFNICHRFKVIMPANPPVELTLRTLDYFDGPERTAYTTGAASVLRCDPKWRRSATAVANRDCFWSHQKLQSFMRRRLENAYGVQ
jgi:hypothetical protein